MKWLINDTLLLDDDNFYTETRAAVSWDHLVSTLTIDNVTVAMSGVYSCVAINSAGVDMASTEVWVTHLSLLYSITWELWFIIILIFTVIFSTFVCVICKSLCR